MMIEYLRGKVLRVDGDRVILDVGGVGYGLDVPCSTGDRLPGAGEETELHVSMVVREDALNLYGFATTSEKGVFDVFLDVSGIGPRTALDILSTISIRDFVSAIQVGNVSVLTSVSGIGPKKAKRMILELKDKVKKLAPFAASEEGGVGSASLAATLEDFDGDGGVGGGEPDLFGDAVAALQALGIKPAMASRSVASALRTAGEEEITVEELVRLALKAGR